VNEIAAYGKVRGLDVGAYCRVGCEDHPIGLSGQGEQLFAWAAAQGQENARGGRSYWVANPIGSPIAAVTAIPTTAVILALFNNEPEGGRSYIIDYVWAHFVVVPAALVHCGIIGLLGQVREAIPTNSAAVVKCSHGMGKLDTLARTVLNTTVPATTGLAGSWQPLGDSIRTSIVSVAGVNIMNPVDGRIIVPPGRYFGVHVLSSVTTSTSIMGIGWTEKQLYLG